MDELQPLLLDTESFRLILASEVPMLYVDKTASLHRLISDRQSRNFFLARPPRFGKMGHRSLLRLEDARTRRPLCRKILKTEQEVAL